jgi:NTE family protein
VQINGEHYWDGGLVSNTPLQYVIEYYPRRSHLVFQVDLFPARGPLPGNLNEVTERDKDIRYSSRTRAGTDALRQLHDLRHNSGNRIIPATDRQQLYSVENRGGAGT